MNVFARHSNRSTGWLSRNRWGLGLLPLAVVLALAASSDRVKPYWWDSDLHEPQPAVQGEWFSHSEPYELKTGEQTMSLRLRLDSVRTMSEQELADPLGEELPPGTKAVEVTMSFEADPGTPLGGCQAMVRDQDGTQYTYQQDRVGAVEAGSPCTPVGAGGPSVLFGELEMPGPDDKERPEKYSVKRAWVLPEKAVVTEVDLWWTVPQYIAFRAGS
ncbi:hypothetical protein [Kineosporia babensis]|uniref:Uncharacterized protein n=1 Tax=Kineosporia babensis TaxID=499548 RepID=A0A9X1STD8_9ACTN|nr:hypothetical protein [Kineosporia babensis]MCD5311697.1 hypothetical protein [Kineosporia babensis]